MQSFSNFLEQQQFVDFVLNEFDTPDPTQTSSPKWSAKKKEIMQSWQNLRPDSPIFMTPMSKGENHKSYGEDGIRINGSWNFIASVLGKLKELIQYENPQTKLRLVFRGVDSGNSDKQSFVFYVNVEDRESKKKGLI